jgi:hypothetical protein
MVNYYVYSTILNERCQDNELLNYVGPYSGSLKGDNLIRFVPVDDVTKQARLYNYLIADGAFNKIMINGKYPGTFNILNQSIPSDLSSNIIITDYQSVTANIVEHNRRYSTSTYLIAKNNNSYNLYYVADSSTGILTSIPGYMTINSRLSVTDNFVVVYTNTCS